MVMRKGKACGEAGDGRRLDEILDPSILRIDIT
jgi:hypothetical protein